MSQANNHPLVAGILQRIAHLNAQMHHSTEPAAPAKVTATAAPTQPQPQWDQAPSQDRIPWEALGFHPHLAGQLQQRLRSIHGVWPSREASTTQAWLNAFLAAQWRSILPAATALPQTHVFIGPAGSGKTTCLSKWLSQTVLVEARAARVLRLDGATANTAESLTVLCEALEVPLARTWTATKGREAAAEVCFIDLPGVDWRDEDAVMALEPTLQTLGPAHVHLVLNGAYEASLLFDQVTAFSRLPVTDLIVTHLDEDPRPGKLWNLVLGTNHALGYLSSGQNVPGGFATALPERLLPVGLP